MRGVGNGEKGVGNEARGDESNFRSPLPIPHSLLPYTVKGDLNAQLACRVLARHTVRGSPSGEESWLHFDRRTFAGARHYGDDGDLQRDSCGRARSVPLQGRGQL